MKTIKSIDQEIEDLKKEIREIRLEEKDKKKANRREKLVSEKIRFRTMMRLYLESMPDEQSLHRQYDSLLNDQLTIEDRFEEWRFNSTNAEKGNNPKVKYDELSGLSEIKSQLKKLRYLLDF